MARFQYFYILRLEFLGFRYSGWQKQNDVKTVQGMLDKTVNFLLESDDFRTLGASRTDARVSADDFAVELLCNAKLDISTFLEDLNKNIAVDVRVKSMSETDATFNILHAPKIKEYHYHFTFGEKPSPNASPFYGYLGNDLNVDLMSVACKSFLGTHNFRNFTGRTEGKTNFSRTIDFIEISESNKLPASILKNRLKLVVRSKGFMKYQIRLMMGALEKIGTGDLTILQLQEMLLNPEDKSYEYVAPGSGLVLFETEF